MHWPESAWLPTFKRGQTVPTNRPQAKLDKNRPTVFRTLFATYTVEQVLGEGNTGTVYAVLDEEGRRYALKGIHPTDLTRPKRKSFRNDIVFCSRNEHPNIVTILDWGVVDSAPEELWFYVMPLFSSTLRDLMKAGIPHDQILPWLAQLLDGVEAAHLQGVRHGDLKPENVLHDPEARRLVVADFGMVHFAGSSLANAQYAAPEQRAHARVDHRADIYALGLILNEMFTDESAQGAGRKLIGSVAPEYAYLDDLVERMVREPPPSARPQLRRPKQH